MMMLNGASDQAAILLLNKDQKSREQPASATRLTDPDKDSVLKNHAEKQPGKMSFDDGKRWPITSALSGDMPYINADQK